jgi:hypothetical protein
MVHWKKTIPGHFKQTARTKYRHTPRDFRWKAKKRRVFGSITDIVASRSTRDQMTQRHPKITKKEVGKLGIIQGVMTLRWPTGHKEQADHRGVTKTDMAREIAEMTNEDLTKLAEEFRNQFIPIMTTMLASSPRMALRFAPWLSTL